MMDYTHQPSWFDEIYEELDYSQFEGFEYKFNVPESDSTLEGPEERNNADFFDPYKNKRKIASLGEIRQKLQNVPRPEYFLPGLKQGTLGFLFGPPKSGKTIYVESLAMHIAACRNEFMGQPLKFEGAKCGIVSLEEGAAMMRYLRLDNQAKAFSKEEQEMIDENFRASLAALPQHVFEYAHWQIIEDAILETGASFICIDSLSRLTPEKLSEEDTAKKIAARLRELVNKHKLTLIVINHTTKASAYGIQSFASMSGSRIYSQDADFIVAVNRTQMNDRYVKLVSSRYCPDESDLVAKFEITDNQLVRLVGKVTEQSLLSKMDGRFDSSNRDLIWEEIQEQCGSSQKDEFFTSDLAHLYEGDTSVMEKKAFHIHLNELMEKQQIERLKKGHYKLKK